MKQQLEQRLHDLKDEFESGQQVLADLDTKRANIQETLLRISGAIQVLEEILAESNDDSDGLASETLDPSNGRIESCLNH